MAGLELSSSLLCALHSSCSAPLTCAVASSCVCPAKKLELGVAQQAKRPSSRPGLNEASWKEIKLSDCCLVLLSCMYTGCAEGVMLMQCVVQSGGSYLLWEVRRYCPAILETVQGKHLRQHDFTWNSFTYLLLSVSVACKPVTFWWLRTLREISEIGKTNQNFRNAVLEISCRPAKREPQIMHFYSLTLLALCSKHDVTHAGDPSMERMLLSLQEPLVTVALPQPLLSRLFSREGLWGVGSLTSRTETRCKNNIILKKLSLSDSNFCKYFLPQTAAWMPTAQSCASFRSVSALSWQVGACAGDGNVGTRWFIPALDWAISRDVPTWVYLAEIQV